MSEVNEMKPVYASVVFRNEGKETTIEGWLSHAEVVDMQGNLFTPKAICIQPSLHFMKDGYAIFMLMSDVISIMPTQPITAYNSSLLTASSVTNQDTEPLQPIAPDGTSEDDFMTRVW